MSKMLRRLIVACGLVASCLAAPPLWAHLGCPCPGPCVCAHPAGCAVACPPVQPCFQTVPVTEYRPVKQTVQRPVVETKMIAQQCTQYVPVTENVPQEVHSVRYETRTSYQTVQREIGQWVNQQHYRPKLAPCEYDNRPDLLGLLNRTGYSIRMAFTPSVTTERRFVSNVVCQQVPVHQTVAVPVKQTVMRQVTRLVPQMVTRQVPVRTVRMETQEVVVNQPVTVFKTVPFGSALAFGPFVTPDSATAKGPAPSGTSTSQRIEPRPDSRFAEHEPLRRPATGATPSTSTGTPAASGSTPASSGTAPATTRPPTGPRGTGLEEDINDPLRRSNPTPNLKPVPSTGRPAGTSSIQDPASVFGQLDNTFEELQPRVVQVVARPVTPEATSNNSASRVGRWVARKSTTPQGPAFPASAILANTGTELH